MLIGEPRLRQLRVKESRCARRVRQRIEIEDCERSYSFSGQETRDFDIAWQLFNTSSGESC